MSDLFTHLVIGYLAISVLSAAVLAIADRGKPYRW